MKFSLTDTIIRTGIFIICAQVLVHFRPKGSYEKYFKMLVSAMILIQLFLPVSNLFTGEGENSLAARVEWFRQQLEQSLEQTKHIDTQTGGWDVETSFGDSPENTFEDASADEAENEEIYINPLEKISIN